MRRGRGFQASPAQQRKIRDQGGVCLWCGQGPADAAHLVPRALDGNGDPDAVIALCRRDHVLFDAGELDILPAWKRMIPELQFMVARVGPSGMVRRLTGRDWISVEREAA